MFLKGIKRILIFGTLFALNGQNVNVNSKQIGNASQNIEGTGYEFEYQTSYNGIVLTMKDELIA